MTNTYYILNWTDLTIRVEQTTEHLIVDNKRIFKDFREADRMRNYLDTMPIIND